MIEGTKVFISYKTGVKDGLTRRASTLAQTLIDAKVDVWMDSTALIPGADWNEQIYETIPNREIVLLLIGDKTMQSEWVRREVDLAKGAKVSILPVKIMADVKLEDALDYFGISTRQTLTFTLNNETERDQLFQAIDNDFLTGRTRRNQWEWLKQRRDKKSGQHSLPTKIFVSHNANEDPDIMFDVNSLITPLEQKGYDVIGVEADVVPGLDSNLEKISDSDIVIVLLTAKSINSLKVRREIDYAKGAKIEIIPLIVKEDFDLKVALTKSLDLNATYATKYLENTKHEMENLLQILKRAEESTSKKHNIWFQTLSTGIEKSQKANSKDSPSKKHIYEPATAELHSYNLAGNNCKVYLSAGNMFEFENPNIDVIVNSENNYMQMARFFESKTVSHQLRKLGAKFDGDNLLEQDTVQDELAELAFATFGRLPVPDGEVIVTSAGHPTSHLRKYNVRYIFHAATILVTDTGIMPIHISATKKSVKTALEKFWEINQQFGVISPLGTVERRIQQELVKHYQPIDSIIFPLFGTGHGQRSVDEAIIPMAEAFFEFLKSTIDNDNNERFGPKRIYLSVFSKEDIELADEVLSRFFQKLS